MTDLAAAASTLAAEARRLRASGHADQALSLLRHASAIAADDLSVQAEYGTAACEAGDYAEALPVLERVVAADPRAGDAWWRLAQCYETFDRTDEAMTAYRRAVEIKPGLTEAGYRGGNLFHLNGLAEEAIALFRRAGEAAPKKSLLGRLCMAKAAIAAENNAEAERALRRALALHPADPAANDLLGTVLAESGRFSEAATYFERAIASGEHMAGSFYELVRCRRFGPDDAPTLARMERAAADSRHPPRVRVRILLALGKVMDDWGDAARAMQHYDAADQERRGICPFDLATFESRLERIIAWFTPERVARLAQHGNPDPTPILIMGLPRSGTTLLEQIMSSHPDVSGAGEVPFWGVRGRSWDARGMPEPDSDFVHGMTRAYLARLRANRAAVPRVSDKMTSNLLWAGLIHILFPRATLFHCRRDLLDTALSIHATHFNPRLEFPTGGAELVAVARGYELIGAHWRKVLPPDRFHQVEYEALTASPEAVVPPLIAACGLAWNDACLHPERNTRSVRTPSKWQTRQPIYRSSVGRAQQYASYLGPLAALAAG